VTDIPDDLRRTLATRFEDAADAARERRVDDALDALDRARGLVETELACRRLTARLEHGCARAAAVAADEPLVAAEYCRAMRDAVAGAGTGPTR
jgi:hypothetical protein